MVTVSRWGERRSSSALAAEVLAGSRWGCRKNPVISQVALGDHGLGC